MRASHGQSIGLSIVMILAGVLAIAAPLVAGISTIIWIAWLLVASGAAHLAYGWYARGHGRLFLEVLISAIYGIAALFLLFNPLAGLASLTFVLVFYFLAAGAVEIFAAFRLHSGEGSRWLYFDGHRHPDPGVHDLERVAVEQRVGHGHPRRCRHAVQRRHPTDAVDGDAHSHAGVIRHVLWRSALISTDPAPTRVPLLA